MAKHWPLNGSECECGDRFEDIDDHLTHARAFIPAWKFWNLKAMTVCTGKSVGYTPGHHVQYEHHSLMTDVYRLQCSCGFENVAIRKELEKWAKEHIRAVIINKIGGYQE